MTNKKRIRKLLSKRYNYLRARKFPEYLIMKNRSVIRFDHFQYGVMCGFSAGRARSKTFIVDYIAKSISREDFKNEYLNQPVPESEYLRYYISKDDFQYITFHKKEMIHPKFYEKAKVKLDLPGLYTASLEDKGFVFLIYFKKKENAFIVLDYRKINIKDISKGI